MVSKIVSKSPVLYISDELWEEIKKGEPIAMQKAYYLVLDDMINNFKRLAPPISKMETTDNQ